MIKVEITILEREDGQVILDAACSSTLDSTPKEQNLSTSLYAAIIKLKPDGGKEGRVVQNIQFGTRDPNDTKN